MIGTFVSNSKSKVQTAAVAITKNCKTSKRRNDTSATLNIEAL
jgi:hypothetical protein